MKKFLFFSSFYLGAASCGCALGLLISLSMGLNVSIDSIFGFVTGFLICLLTHLYVRHKIATDGFAEPKLNLQDFADVMIAKDDEGERQRLTCEKLEELGFRRKSYSKRLDMFVLDDGVLSKIELKKFIKDTDWRGVFECTDAEMNTRKLVISGGLEFEDDLRGCAETVGISIERLAESLQIKN
jgi:hypothetical protein